MIEPSKIFGRLGNSLFQYAFLFAHSKDFDIDYYYQDERFFKDHSEAIRVLFSGDIPPLSDYVAIHVRRGDYVGNPFYVDLLATDYYERAMKEFPEDTKFMVFSDDIDWCMKQPIFENCEFSFEENEIDDLNLMAACKGHIIANSSFSWWGAWLHPRYPDNKVIAPKSWYSDGVQRTVLPTHWKRI